MSDLHLVEEGASRLEFSDASFATRLLLVLGALAAAAGVLLLAWGGTIQVLADPETDRAIRRAFFAVVLYGAWRCLRGGLWREGLTIDLGLGTYAIRQGFLGSVRVRRSGPLSDIQGVILDRPRGENTGGGVMPVWRLSLSIREEAPVVVKETLDNAAASILLGRWARKTRAPAVDRTGQGERPAASEARGEPPQPPPGIAVAGDPGSRIVTMPRSDRMPETLFLFFVCAAVAVLLWGELKILGGGTLPGGERVFFSSASAVLAGGALLAWAAARRRRDGVRESGGHLEFGTVSGGSFSCRFRMEKIKIEGVELYAVGGACRPAGAAASEADRFFEARRPQRLIIRAPEDFQEIGKGLDSSQKEWLRRFLLDSLP